MKSTLVARLAAAALACAASVVGLGAVVGAQTSDDPSPTPITDYANYPLGLGIIPDSCTASSGAEMVVNPRFSVDGGAEVTDLRQLDLRPPAEAVTMRWDGFAPGCEGVGISMSGKVSGATVFDPDIDQIGDRTAYCGPGAGMIPCQAPFQLTLLLTERPGQADVPCFQVDASIGPPLAVVGPSGSFYGILNGRFDMLISAWNGGREPCTVPPVTVTTLATTTTTAPPPTAPPPTAPPTTPFTTPPSTSATSAAIRSTTTSVAVAGVQATIPRTGAGTGETTGAGALLIVLGGASLAAASAITRRVRHL